MIDILLSTYNGSSFLKEQINSIVSQTFNDWNLLIRDDGSSDDTLDIIRTYINNYPNKISLIPAKQNLGSSGSFFELLKYSTSDLICFCDQDDVWEPTKLETLMFFYKERLINLDSPFLVHTKLKVVDEKLNLLSEQTEQFNTNKQVKHDLIWHIFQNNVTGCSVMINSVMKNLVIDKLDDLFVIQHDWFLALIAFCFSSLYFIDQFTINYRQHSNNVIGTKKISLAKKVKLALKAKNYPFYKQIQSLLKVVPDKQLVNLNLLVDFSKLDSCSKICRILWHIKNKFYREGNFFYKMYQLWVC